MTFLNREQDRVTGDYSQFWWERDYLRRAGGVESSVFVVHGLNDWNVMTKAFAEWWYRLADLSVPRKLWLHNGGHGGESASDTADFALYKRTENRWFDHELFGVPNGIFSEPRSSIEREDGTYAHEADWPLPGARNARLQLAADSSTAPGELSTLSPGGSHDQSFVDRGRELDTDDVLIQNPDSADPNRLIYRSPSLGRDARISGTPRVSLRMSIDNRTAANLTAVLVDYGPAGAAPLMVTRGWMDPQNRDSLSRSERRQGGPGVPLPLGPAARRLRVQGRPPDRAGGGVDRLRLHAPADAGHPAHAGPGRQRGDAAGRRRIVGARLLEQREVGPQPRTALGRAVHHETAVEGGHAVGCCA